MHKVCYFSHLPNCGYRLKVSDCEKCRLWSSGRGKKEDEKNMKMSNFHFIPKINVLLIYLLVGVFTACALGFLYHS